MTGARPLLPANPQDHSGGQQQYQAHALHQDPAGGAFASASGSGGSGGGGEGGKPGAPGKPQYAKRGKITIVACVPCRRRKTKCDGKRPVCSQCSSRDSQCHYDMTDDQRKLTFLRDNVEHLQEKSSNLEGLLHTVQTANDEEAAEIFRRLRSGTDVQHVAEQVHAGRLLSGVSRRDSELSSPYTGGDQEGSRVRQYDLLMQQLASANPNDTNEVLRRIRRGEDVTAIVEAIHLGNLSPMRLVRSGPAQLPATLEGDFSGQEQTFGIIKGASVAHTHAAAGIGAEFKVSKMKQPWTKVTPDSGLVEYLLSLYFTWQHSFFQSFPEDLFRSDYDKGSTKYCSSMLVNSICASGCFLADPDKLKERDEGWETLAERFYEAAVGQLDIIKESSITTTAALYLISYFEGTRGRLSNLWMYSGRSSLMAIDLNLHLRRSYKESTGTSEQDQERQNERQARCHAFWGAFHVDQLTAFTLGRLPNLNSHGITQEPPPVDEEEDKQPWAAAELGITSQRPGAKSSTFSHCSTLSRLVNGTLHMFFAPLVPLSGSLLIDEYDKYQDWYKSLPVNLSETKDAPPHVLCLHMYYWAAILHLFRPFLKATINNSDVVPREMCRSAANNLSDLMNEHQKLFQLSGIYMFQVHCLLTACTIHIINIPSIQATRHFTEACNFFQALFARNEWARSCLKILRNLVEKWKLILPLEAEEALYRDRYSDDPNIAPSSSSSSDLPRLQHATDPSTVFEEVQSTDRDRGARPGPYPRQHPGVGAGKAQSQAKRSSSSGGQRSIAAANLPSPGPQKRQRTMAPASASGPSSTIPRVGAVDTDAAVPMPTAENFLYSPLAGHTVPMLLPVQGRTPTASMIAAGPSRQRLPTGRPPPATRAAVPAVASAADSSATVAAMSEPAPARDSTMAPPARVIAPQQAPSAVPIPAPEGQAALPPGSLLPAAHPPAAGPTAKRERGNTEDATGEPTGEQNEVEGLSFGDDWRDPFMGFLGQGYHED